MARRSIDPRVDKSFWTDQHRKAANLPLAWSLVTQEMRRGASGLWDQVDADSQRHKTLKVGDPVAPTLTRPTMLLAALTVELFLKAICVRKKPAFDTSGRFQLKTHKLLDLAERAAFPLEDGEEELLERLEVFLEWAGRYPVPVEATKMLPRTNKNGGFGLLYNMASDDRAAWEGLVERLNAALS
jgi:hypothetical protein